MAKLHRVGLFSPMGTGNLGDASTQDAVIYNLRKRVPDIEICGFSLNPGDTAKRHGIPSYSIFQTHWERYLSKEGVSPLYAAVHDNKFVRLLRRLIVRLPQEIVFNIHAFRQMRTLDLVIFSGSGQLADVWRKADQHSYSILRWSLLAKLIGVPVCFISVGAGPLNSKMNRIFVKWALSMAAYRSYRDNESKQYMASIGFDKGDPVLPDLAHSIAGVEEFRQQHNESDGFVVGINPMVYAAPGLWYDEHDDTHQAYLNKLAEFVTWLVEHKIGVVFYPSAVPPDDHVIVNLRDLLRESFGVTLDEDTHPVHTVTDLLTKVAAVDVVVASRFHGILLPFVLHKPVIALSYHPKDVSLMKDMGMSEYCLNIDTFDVQSLIDHFTLLRENLDKIRQAVVAKEAEYRKHLDEQYEIVIKTFSHT